MAQYITRGGNGPAAGGADALQTDQSKLSYSFDFKDAHFVTLNTDPVGKDWHVPTAWLGDGPRGRAREGREAHLRHRTQAGVLVSDRADGRSRVRRSRA